MSHFISESAIFQEAKVVKSSSKKAIFRMVMQDADMINRNKRLYPFSVLDQGMSECQDRMKRNAFFGELDHPTPSGEEIFDNMRQTVVMLKEVSHIIRNYEWRGKQLIGELESTTTPNGYILAGLLQDHSGIGLSMRGLASIKKRDDHNEVEGPLTIISFDSVSLPSHESALVDFNEMKFESKFLVENVTQSGETICTPDGHCYLANYFDKLVETKVVDFFDKWV